MSVALHREDPGALSVDEVQVRRTLDVLRRDPIRGRAVVAEHDGQVVGYALLIAFWSNELGEVCEVDELFVVPAWRSRGIGGALFAAIDRGDIWPPGVAAIALGVTPRNPRARRLYERLGFESAGVVMARIVRARVQPATLRRNSTPPSA